MPAEEARTFLQQIQEKIASSDIEVPHRDVLIRLRSIIEEDLKAEYVPSRAVSRREPAAPPPSTIRSSRAFKHPNGAALRIAPLFGPALSDHVRAGPCRRASLRAEGAVSR